MPNDMIPCVVYLLILNWKTFFKIFNFNIFNYLFRPQSNICLLFKWDLQTKLRNN